MDIPDGKMRKKSLCLACGQEFVGEVINCPRDGTRLTPISVEPDMVGEILDKRYRIVEEIGNGSSSVVYKAEQLTVNNRPVAIKILRSHLANCNESMQRFQREAQATSKLKHKNLLAVFDFGFTKSRQPYMVTEYLSGITLATLVEERGPLRAEGALPIFIQLCSGMALAHENQVLHRDLKPSNIILLPGNDNFPVVKVIDFGFVKFLAQDAAAQKLTRTGQVFGSPSFMSPEQCSTGSLDVRSDIYSLGCALYYTLSGRPPFDSADSLDVFYKQLNEVPPAFSVVAPHLRVPPALEEIVMRALEKKLVDRFQSMAEFERALDYLEKSMFRSREALPSGINGRNTEIPTRTEMKSKALAISNSRETGQATNSAVAASGETSSKTAVDSSSVERQKRLLSHSEPGARFDTITSSIIGLLENIDAEIDALRKAGVNAMRGENKETVKAVIDRTRQLEQLRKEAAALAKSWTDIICP